MERVKKVHVKCKFNFKKILINIILVQNSVSGEIVATAGLRFLNFYGEVVYVDSEWAAFVNPWTKQVEMVVGRHKRSITCNKVEKLKKTTQQQIIKETNSAKPIIENNMGAYMERIVESLVMNNNSSSQNLLINQSQKINETIKEPSLSYNQVIFR